MLSREYLLCYLVQFRSLNTLTVKEILCSEFFYKNPLDYPIENQRGNTL